MTTCSPMRRKARQNDRSMSLLFIAYFLLGSVHGQEHLLDMLNRLAESIGGGLATDGSTTSNSATASNNNQAQTIAPDNQKRQQIGQRKTQRRALFEHTLLSHFTTFHPGHDNNNNQRLRQQQHLQQQQQHASDVVIESWYDEATACLLYNEEGTNYWTYRWCPQRLVTQVRLVPTKLTNGVQDFRVDKIHKLGIYDAESNKESLLDEGQLRTEYYTNGEVCQFGQNMQRPRQVLVQYHPTNVACSWRDEDLTIVKVTEPSPCQYVLHVCQKSASSTMRGANGEPHPSGSNESPKVRTVEQQATMQEARSRIEAAYNVYTQMTGIGAANMLVNDKVISNSESLPPYPPSRREASLTLVRDMFAHAYDSYMYHAYPAAELKPLTCRPGTFDLIKLPALTLIDTLDTLVIMSNFTEFARGVERIRDIDKSLQEATNTMTGERMHIVGGGIFASNQNVSLFETNIRVLGGLLSAHQLAVAYLESKVLSHNVRDSKGNVLIGPLPTVCDESTTEAPKTATSTKTTLPSEEECQVTNADTNTCEVRHLKEGIGGTCVVNGTKDGSVSYWEYDGVLLKLAEDLGRRLLPAFRTKTGIPYGTVNLMDGIPNGESRVASLAGAGTLTLEFELLTRMTNYEVFGRAAKLATRALWMRRSKRNLLGKHINIERGTWTETLSGIGSNSDSFYEYLVKHFVLFPEDEDFWPMFISSYQGLQNQSRAGEWYADVDMNVGLEGAQRRVFESLMAFFPGLQVLLGEISPAAKTLNGFFMARETVGLLPERFNYAQWKVDGPANGGGSLHPLRPELLESCYFLHKSSEGMSSARTNRSRAASDTSGWLWAADYALQSLNWHTWAQCGFSSVKGVSQQVTGGIPGAQGNLKAGGHRPKAVNEMPSFFLSETLKYLYLAFDRDNILHQDDDRQWIFTTEAHPIHHEPVASASFSEESIHVVRIRKLLKDRASGKAKKSFEMKKPCPKNSNWEELWTDKTLMADYLAQVSETEKSMETHVPRDVAFDVVTGDELFDHNVILPSYRRLGSFHGIRQDEENIAHLSLAPHGSIVISKSCPNIYSPSLSWVNALSGGTTDYANVYHSTVHDNIPVDQRYGVALMSAMSALGYYGTGLYIGRSNVPGCRISRATDAITAPETQKRKGQESQRLTLGHHGIFEVSVFPEGVGFYVKQVKTGQTLMITIVRNENPPDDDVPGEERELYVMVHATMPRKVMSTDIAKKTKSFWQSVFSASNLPSEGETAEVVLEKAVVVGDGQGNSFSCSIEVLERLVLESHPIAISDDLQPMEVEHVILSIPCSPGLFGPSSISKLVDTNGITIEGSLSTPNQGDETGCEEASAEESEVAMGDIVIVKRGSCTFESKALNQRKRGANAVIVINHDNQDLFLMAHGYDGKADEEDIPLSTLITGSDGSSLLNVIEGGRDVKAKIVLTPQYVQVDDEGNMYVNDEAQFPLLRGTPNAIQIFAKDGWGLTAAEVDGEERIGANGEQETQRDWQLLLGNHNFDTDADVN